MSENVTLEKEREWFPTFLAVLRNTANVRAACEKAKIDRRTAYRNRDDNESFRARWDTAIEDACDQLEAAAWLRAKGRSDTLLIFLLKAHRPERYREMNRSLNVTLTADELGKLSDDDLERLITQLCR